MALAFLLDEHLRGPLWHGVQQHNATGVSVLDVLRVGDPPAPPLGTPDPDILLWAEQHGRIVVTEDRRTMPVHLASHLQAGHHSPGVFILPYDWTVPQVIISLVLHDQLGAPQDYVDGIEYL